MLESDGMRILALTGAGIAVLAVFLVVLMAFVKRFVVGPELAGVDARSGEWASFAYVTRSSRPTKLWGRYEVEGDEDSAEVAAELAVSAGGRVVLSAPEPGLARYLVSTTDKGGRFTQRLGTIPALPAGTPVEVRVCVRGVGVRLAAARIYVST